MDLAKIKKLVKYDPILGRLYLCKNNRLLTPDDYGMVTIYDNSTRKKKKFRYAVLCWQLGNDKLLPEGSRILHRNLDDRDFRLQYLRAVPRDKYLLIQESVRNLENNLKIHQHPDDQYSYVIRYKENGIEKREVIYDIAAAKKRLLRLRLKYAKIIYSNCIFD